MTNRVGAHPFGFERWHLGTGLEGVTFDHRMDSKACDRLMAAVEENPLRKTAMGYQSR